MKKAIVAISTLVLFLIFSFIFQASGFSQKCDTIQITECDKHFSGVFPFHNYVVYFGNKTTTNNIIINADSNAVISKDSLGNIYIYFESNKFLPVESKISYNMFLNDKNDSMTKKFNFLPAQIFIYFMDNNGSYMLSGDTIGNRKLLNAQLSAGTIFSNKDKSFDIVSFTVVFRKNNKLKMQKVIGPYINKKMLRDIYRLPKGKPIIIKDIWIEFQDDYTIYIDPIIIYR